MGWIFKDKIGTVFERKFINVIIVSCKAWFILYQINFILKRSLSWVKNIIERETKIGDLLESGKSLAGKV